MVILLLENGQMSASRTLNRCAYIIAHFGHAQPATLWRYLVTFKEIVFDLLLPLAGTTETDTLQVPDLIPRIAVPAALQILEEVGNTFTFIFAPFATLSFAKLANDFPEMVRATRTEIPFGAVDVSDPTTMGRINPSLGRNLIDGFGTE